MAMLWSPWRRCGHHGNAVEATITNITVLLTSVILQALSDKSSLWSLIWSLVCHVCNLLSEWKCTTSADAL